MSWEVIIILISAGVVVFYFGAVNRRLAELHKRIGELERRINHQTGPVI